MAANSTDKIWCYAISRLITKLKEEKLEGLKEKEIVSETSSSSRLQMDGFESDGTTFDETMSEGGGSPWGSEDDECWQAEECPLPLVRTPSDLTTLKARLNVSKLMGTLDLEALLRLLDGYHK